MGKGGDILVAGFLTALGKAGATGKDLIKRLGSHIKTGIKKIGHTPVEDEKGNIGVQTPEGVKYVPPNVEIEDAGDVVEYFRRTLKPAQEFLYEEPPDDVLTKGTFDKTHEALPEYYEGELLPKSKVPNINVLKTWIETVKWANMSPLDLRMEYNSLKGTTSDAPLNTVQREALKDSIAYKIARKFWYVGRRSAQETDAQFNERTKHMRPAMGSFSPNDIWTGQTFPYDETYQYTSGHIPEMEQKLKEGETIKW